MLLCAFRLAEDTAKSSRVIRRTYGVFNATQLTLESAPVEKHATAVANETDRAQGVECRLKFGCYPLDKKVAFMYMGCPFQHMRTNSAAMSFSESMERRWCASMKAVVKYPSKQQLKCCSGSLINGGRSTKTSRTMKSTVDARVRIVAIILAGAAECCGGEP